MINRPQRLQFLATVAELYYKENRSQAEIARKLGYSRSAISRLLSEAREEGLIEIRINYPVQRVRELESMLKATFSLKEAYVIDRGGLSYDQILRYAGEMGANFLLEHLKDNSVLAITWGTAVQAVASALPAMRFENLQIVQMIGSVGSGDPQIDGHELAQTFAKKLGGRYHTVNAPLFVKDWQTRDMLLEEASIKRTLDLAVQADMAIVGIGSTMHERSSHLRSGFLTEPETELMRNSGAVGDICSMHIDIHGKILPLAINRRVIGLHINQLRENNRTTVVAVAAGAMKGPAILGALRGQFVDVLVTDSSAAALVLENENNFGWFGKGHS
ncbi:MAG: sugar-binding transcriptional regulator [Ardenticatenaceae bacterium]|nr:sugar-binding transcriptional regulator [Ardenticatenaceae bacterium]